MSADSRRGFLRTSLRGSVLAAGMGGVGSGASLYRTVPAAPWIPRTLSEWKAHWIWDDYNRETTNIYVCLRKGATLAAPVRSASVWCTANTWYRLYLNGQRIGMGPNPNEPPFKYYDYYDAGAVFRQGENTIAALCFNLGIGTHFCPAGPGGFLFQAVIQLEDGQTVTVASDSTWRVAIPRWYLRYAPQQLWSSGFQEYFDMRREAPDWTTNLFEPPDDDPQRALRWYWAADYGAPPSAPYLHLLPREIPYLRQTYVAPARVIHTKISELPADWAVQEAEMRRPNPNAVTRMALELESEAPAGSVTAPDNLLRDDGSVTTILPQPAGKSTRILIEFGEQQVGHAHIDFASMDGGVVDIGYSEFMMRGDRIDLLRDTLQGDRIILAKGARSWESYDQRSFRYLLLQAQGLKAPLEIRHLKAARTAYPVEYAGAFECSDEMLNRIWKASRLSTEFNMWDQYIDGPVRERGQYAGDIRTTALWNYYLFGDRLLMAKALRHFARIQDASGWFKTLSPSGTRHNIVEMMMQWVIAIWEYFWYTGDDRLARELAPSAYQALRWFEPFQESDGLIGKAHLRDWWVFIDWGKFDFRDRVAGVNLWYFQALESAVKLAELRGDTSEAESFGRLARRVSAGIEQRFWNPAQNAYVDCWADGSGPSPLITRQTNYLAILSGAAPRDRWRAMVERVTRSDTSRIQTPYFKFFELESWDLAGRGTDAVFAEMRAWWGEQIHRGATTFWEVFDDQSPADAVPEGTCCHSWCGGPAVIMGQQVLGVKPAAPGFGKAVVRPRWAGLEFARGAVPSPGGNFEISWERKTSTGAARVDLTLPKCQATVGVPVEEGNHRVSYDGHEAWDKGRGLAQTAGARLERDGYLYLDIRGPGRHSIRIE